MAMMKEILRNGPINGDMKTTEYFDIYGDGVFSEEGLFDLH